MKGSTFAGVVCAVMAEVQDWRKRERSVRWVVVEEGQAKCCAERSMRSRW